MLPRLCRTATHVLKPGDIVILDNLGSHKSATLRRMLRAAGARLWYLPPYSPDLNPIEQGFTKIKHWMRTAQKRTVEDTWRYIGSLLATIPPSECNNYFHQRRICFRQSVKRLASWDLGSEDGAFECTRPAIVALNEGTDGRASKSQRR